MKVSQDNKMPFPRVRLESYDPKLCEHFKSELTVAISNTVNNNPASLREAYETARKLISDIQPPNFFEFSNNSGVNRFEFIVSAQRLGVLTLLPFNQFFFPWGYGVPDQFEVVPSTWRKNEYLGSLTTWSCKFDWSTRNVGSSWQGKSAFEFSFTSNLISMDKLYESSDRGNVFFKSAIEHCKSKNITKDILASVVGRIIELEEQCHAEDYAFGLNQKVSTSLPQSLYFFKPHLDPEFYNYILSLDKDKENTNVTGSVVIELSAKVRSFERFVGENIATHSQYTADRLFLGLMYFLGESAASFYSQAKLGTLAASYMVAAQFLYSSIQRVIRAESFEPFVLVKDINFEAMYRDSTLMLKFIQQIRSQTLISEEQRRALVISLANL